MHELSFCWYCFGNVLDPLGRPSGAKRQRKPGARSRLISSVFDAIDLLKIRRQEEPPPQRWQKGKTREVQKGEGEEEEEGGGKNEMSRKRKKGSKKSRTKPYTP